MAHLCRFESCPKNFVINYQQIRKAQTKENTLYFALHKPLHQDSHFT